MECPIQTYQQSPKIQWWYCYEVLCYYNVVHRSGTCSDPIGQQVNLRQDRQGHTVIFQNDDQKMISLAVDNSQGNQVSFIFYGELEMRDIFLDLNARKVQIFRQKRSSRRLSGENWGKKTFKF